MIMEVTCKLGEKGCWNDGKCRATSNCENKVVTNVDRIRAMSDEELAEFLNTSGCPSENHSNCFGMSCKHCWEKWLKQPAE
jgi:hypothetical protein